MLLYTRYADCIYKQIVLRYKVDNMKTTNLEPAPLRVISILGFYFLELLSFFVAYFLGFYKQILLEKILVSVSSLPIPSQLNSFLLIVLMTLPIVLLVSLLNRKFFQLGLKIFLITHLIVIATIWAVLELMLFLI